MLTFDLLSDSRSYTVCPSTQSIMEQFNPGLQRMVALGNSYIQAFQGKSTLERMNAVDGLKGGRRKAKRLNFGLLAVIDDNKSALLERHWLIQYHCLMAVYFMSLEFH